MAQTTREASYIIVLSIVISVVPISSTLLQESYLICFIPKTEVTKDQVPIKHWDLFEPVATNPYMFR
jgi:hypothetical protein